MILELAIQSVQTKIKLKSATMLGNYEFYYAAGILCRELNLTVAEDIKPKELHAYIDGLAVEKEFDDPTVAHLIKMIHFYMPEEQYDEQMKELFQVGLNGK